MLTKKKWTLKLHQITIIENKLKMWKIVERH